LEGKLQWANAWPSSLCGALALAPVTFIAAVFRENLFAGFGIARGSRFALFALLRGVLRSRCRCRQKEDRTDRRQSDAADSPREATLARVHGWQEDVHAFPIVVIVPQDRFPRKPNPYIRQRHRDACPILC